MVTYVLILITSAKVKRIYLVGCLSITLVVLCY